MVDFRHLSGVVYIFENKEAKRIKVGMTINDVSDRLDRINDIWTERMVTCQVCGERRVHKEGLVPPHSRGCSGGNSLPLERDVSLAVLHLEKMKRQLDELTGSEKGSATRRIKNLEKRIELYRDHYQTVGTWQFSTAYYTESAEQVELLSHGILDKYLDEQAPFGEVFTCSVSEASEAVETILSQLGLLISAKKVSTV